MKAEDAGRSVQKAKREETGNPSPQREETEMGLKTRHSVSVTWHIQLHHQHLLGMEQKPPPSEPSSFNGSIPEPITTCPMAEVLDPSHFQGLDTWGGLYGGGNQEPLRELRITIKIPTFHLMCKAHFLDLPFLTNTEQPVCHIYRESSNHSNIPWGEDERSNM